MNRLVNQWTAGDPNTGIGTRHLFKDAYELLGKNHVRVYFKREDGKVQIWGKSVKNNQDQVLKILKELYGYFNSEERSNIC